MIGNKAKITFFGYVRDGNINIVNRDEFKRSILAMFPTGQFQMTIQKKRKQRSGEQNGYYWAVVIPLVKDGLIEAGNMGVTKEMAHEYLKKNFLEKRQVFDLSGNITELDGSTKTLTTLEMMDYFTEIQAWAAMYLNKYIPDPNEQIEFNFE